MSDREIFIALVLAMVAGGRYGDEDNIVEAAETVMIVLKQKLSEL